MVLNQVNSKDLIRGHDMGEQILTSEYFFCIKRDHGKDEQVWLFEYFFVKWVHGKDVQV